MKYTNTTYFLLPVLELDGGFNTLTNDGFIDSYIGWEKHLPDTWGEHLYLVFNSEQLPEPRLAELKAHDKFIDVVVDDDLLVFIFDLSDNFKEKVIKPFIKGKYSQISRKFVENYHPTYVRHDPFSHSLNKARLILDKDDSIRQEWEERLNTSLPENAEVWSIPSKETEILDYFINEKFEIHENEHDTQLDSQ